MKTVKDQCKLSIAEDKAVDVHGFDDIGNTIVLDPTKWKRIEWVVMPRRQIMWKEMYTGGSMVQNGNIINSDFQAGEDNSGDAIIRNFCTNVKWRCLFYWGEKGSLVSIRLWSENKGEWMKIMAKKKLVITQKIYFLQTLMLPQMEFSLSQWGGRCCWSIPDRPLWRNGTWQFKQS